MTVPVDEDGMMCENLEGLIELHRPKFIYVNSSYHDPTGNILSVERRNKLLEISNRYRLPIVEGGRGVRAFPDRRYYAHFEIHGPQR